MSLIAEQTFVVKMRLNNYFIFDPVTTYDGYDGHAVSFLARAGTCKLLIQDLFVRFSIKLTDTALITVAKYIEHPNH